MDIYVGNLSYDTSDSQLNEVFQQKGQVNRATVVKDRVTDRSRGFGFVEMPVPEEAREAIESLNGTELDGRALTVNEARPRTQPSTTDRSNGGNRY